MSLSLATLDVSEATRIVNVALTQAETANLKIAVVVTDRQGHLLAAARMNETSYILVAIAQGKALGSVALGAPSQAIAQMMSEDKILANGVLAGGHIVPLAGGLPIMENGQVIGAIGIAGGHYTQDQQVAEATLAALQ